MSDEERWTRGAVADHLGVSVSTVRRFEKRGKLHPAIGEGDVRLHDADEVRALAVELASEVCAGEPAAEDVGEIARLAPEAGLHGRIFALLHEDVRPTEVVERLNVHPRLVQAALKWFRQLQAEEIVDLETCEAIYELRRVFAALADRVAMLEARFMPTGGCPSCGSMTHVTLEAHTACCGAPVSLP